MSPRVLLEYSRGQFLENCRNRVRGRFWRNRQTFPCTDSGSAAKPDVTTSPTSRRSPSAFAIQTPSPSLSDSADVDASPPLVFPEVPTNSTPSCLGARSGSPGAQQWPKHLGRPSPPHGRPAGPPTLPQGLSPPHGRRAPCRRMVHRHAPRSCPNHLAATAPSVYLHTTDQELAQSPQSHDYTQLVHSTCWQSLITPRSRPPLPLTFKNNWPWSE